MFLLRVVNKDKQAKCRLHVSAFFIGHQSIHCIKHKYIYREVLFTRTVLFAFTEESIVRVNLRARK